MDICECGVPIEHAEDHPDQCCTCFDVECGMPVHQALREERKKARREGMIAGLERALDMNDAWDAVDWSTKIRAEVERLKGGA